MQRNRKSLTRIFFQKSPKAIQQIARRKLIAISISESLNDLRVPPNNRLEKLSGDHSNQHSIRINQQYQICFEWKNNHAFQVEIVDYH